MSKTVKFSWPTVHSFRDLSQDLNPLHLDESYSRRTQFGKPIVYGIAAVLYGLGQWAGGRGFKLDAITVQFNQPLFVNEEYTLEIREDGREVSVRFGQGKPPRLRLDFTWSPFHGEPTATVGDFRPLQEALAPIDPVQAAAQWRDGNFSYARGADPTDGLVRFFALAPGQMPRSQLDALLGASYFVGMILPGRQALFSELEIAFSAPERAFALAGLHAEWDSRFQRYAITGAGAGIESFSVSAFQRPPPADPSRMEIAAVLTGSVDLQGKSVFVTGGSRGFGAVIAKALAVNGARLWIGYRSGRSDAEAVARDIGGAQAVPGDVGNAIDCAQMASTVDKSVDILINNAFPPIQADAFAGRPVQEREQWVRRAVDMTRLPVEAFLERLSPGATVLNISTVYTQKPQAGFEHYVEAKLAVEELTHRLAKDYPNFKWVVARPPRMRTDQTNLAFDPLPAETTLAVAGRLIEGLKTLPAGGGFFTLDL